MSASPAPGATTAGTRIARVFGADNRARLMARWFEAEPAVGAGNAWRHVYRLLLWIDRTTALAHCYESDKAQPGRPWYARTLAFHDWLSAAFGVPPAELAQQIDWLFRAAVADLAEAAVAARGEAYQRQREPYHGRGFPEPGEDPELAAMVRELLAPWLSQRPSEEVLRRLTRRIHAHLNQENKRRNLVGEGFEDVLGEIICRLPGAEPIAVKRRALLHDLPGFHQPAPSEKVKKVDLALISNGHRTLVSAKWSVRADREEQFLSDFEAYARLESAGQNFSYVLVTNEFDAARLKAACDRRRQNAPLFSRVVHINPEAVLAAYGTTGRGAAAELAALMTAGRLLSLADWLNALTLERADRGRLP